MKYIITVTALFATCLVKAQRTVPVIDMNGIEIIQLGMSQQDVEKVIGKKIPLTNPTDTISGSWMDSASISYKNIPLKLSFVRNYYDSAQFNMRVVSISTGSNLVITEKKIRCGSAKADVINAYEFLPMEIFPEYGEDGNLTGGSFIYVFNESRSSSFRFRFLKNKLVSIEATNFFDSED